MKDPCSAGFVEMKENVSKGFFAVLLLSGPIHVAKGHVGPQGRWKKVANPLAYPLAIADVVHLHPRLLAILMAADIPLG